MSMEKAISEMKVTVQPSGWTPPLIHRLKNGRCVLKNLADSNT